MFSGYKKREKEMYEKEIKVGIIKVNYTTFIKNIARLTDQVSCILDTLWIVVSTQKVSNLS